jgi:DNA polymerase-3 subunit beta
MNTATLNAISHRDLPAAMAAVARFAAGKRCQRPILQNVMLSTGVAGTMVAATDLETLCVVHLPGGSGDGKTLLPASLAKQIAKDKCCTVECDDAGEGSTVSACGVTAAAEDTMEFPHCWPLDPAAPAVRIPFAVVDQIDGACSPATDTESSRYALGGVLLETAGDDKLYAIGTDGRRLHALGAAATVDAPLMTIVRPGAVAGFLKAVRAVAAEVYGLKGKALAGRLEGDAVEIRTAANTVELKWYSRGYTVTVKSLPIEGRFPRWRDVFPAGCCDAPTIRMDAGEAAKQLKQAKAATNEQCRGVLFAAGRMTAGTVDAGQYSAWIAGSMNECQPVKLDPLYVLAGIDAIDAVKTPGQYLIHVVDSRSACYMRAAGGHDANEKGQAGLTVVIMPLAAD